MTSLSEKIRAPEHYWTKEEDAALRCYVREGLTDAEIGERMCLHDQQVRWRRRILGIRKRRGRINPRPEWTEDMVATPKHLFDKGKDDDTIATALGISPYAVEYKRKNLGWVRYRINDIPTVQPLNQPEIKQGDTVKLTHKSVGRPSDVESLNGSSSHVEFLRPLVFEGIVKGVGDGRDKYLFRSKAGWRVTLTLAQLQDYEVEVVS